MKLKIRKKPRQFSVGKNNKIKINDFGKIYLENNEQLTFITENNSKYDVTRKNWGFYATQSVNSRLKKNFKTALAHNASNKIYVMLVEKKFLKEFKKYCVKENQKIICWLDDIK